MRRGPPPRRPPERSRGRAGRDDGVPRAGHRRAFFVARARAPDGPGAQLRVHLASIGHPVVGRRAPRRRGARAPLFAQRGSPSRIRRPTLPVAFQMRPSTRRAPSAEVMMCQRLEGKGQIGPGPLCPRVPSAARERIEYEKPRLMRGPKGRVLLGLLVRAPSWAARCRVLGDERRRVIFADLVQPRLAL